MMKMSLKRFWTLALSLFLIVTLVIGCAPQGPESAGQPSQQKSQETKYPLEVKDQAGNTVKIEKEPKRIVSLIPSNTEIAFALGLGKQVVGVTTNDDYPAEVKSLPKVGDFKINVENVVALKPDLVLAGGANDKGTIDQLKKLGIDVLVLDAKSVNDVYASIALVGQATNHAREADQLVTQMREAIRRVSEKTASLPKEKRAKVWIELDPTLFTTGGDTFMNELVQLAGGENVAAGLKGWPQVSAEQVVKWNPDVILSTYGGEKEILARKGWETVSAVKNKRVYSVDANLTSRPGPRITQAVEQIAAKLYPEQFAGKK
jgi:iron complex transport system substrate-binding protein